MNEVAIIAPSDGACYGDTTRLFFVGRWDGAVVIFWFSRKTILEVAFAQSQLVCNVACRPLAKALGWVKELRDATLADSCGARKLHLAPSVGG
ncbi:hypothetical protein GY15_28335 [Delftia sp. 670]|nr:hypothetical protein GY15_28335 [Delftia sp. 670]